MSYQATKAILALRNLTPTEKAVAHSFAGHAHSDGTESFPSLETVKFESGLGNRQAVQKVVRRLERKGILTPTSAKKGGKGCPTHYRINMTKSIPTDAVSSPNSIHTALQTASQRTPNSIPPDARIEVKEESSSNGAATFSESQMVEEILAVRNYYLDAFDKEEPFSPSEKKMVRARLLELREAGYEYRVYRTAAAIDMAKALSRRPGKAYFEQWHTIFGKKDTFGSLLYDYENNDGAPEAAALDPKFEPKA